MKKLSEHLFPSDFSVYDEYRRLEYMFCEEKVYRAVLDPILHRTEEYSYMECLSSMFLGWKLRGICTSTDEMLHTNGITDRDFKKDPSEKRLLEYIQFILNAAMFVEKNIESKHYDLRKVNTDIFKAMLYNSGIIAAHFGAELQKDDNEEFYVMYSDSVATAISVEHPEVKMHVVDYLKIGNTGNLQRKREVLASLAVKLEPYESDIKKKYSPLLSDTKFLLNRSGIRHAVKADDQVEGKFADMSDEELIVWCDKTFEMLLACFAVIPCVAIQADIKEIKKT